MIDGADIELVAQAHEFLRAPRGGFEDPNDPSTVQAMQIALNVPKQGLPSRTALLEAAGSAVALVCLDPRAISDPSWHRGLENWYGHRIRKIARRGRNKSWRDVQDLPGVTATVGSAEARAFVPSAVADVPTAIGKLQIAGTDLDYDEPGEIDPTIPTVYVDKSLGMSAGKAAAQVGHGSMLLAASLNRETVIEWFLEGCPLQAREVEHAIIEQASNVPGAVAVRDAGFTEVAPNSLTVVATPARR